MKFMKMIILTLITIIALSLSACGDSLSESENQEENYEEKSEENQEEQEVVESLETNYYIPEVLSNFNEISEEKFSAKFSEALNNTKTPSYKFAGVIVRYEKPLDVWGTEFSEDYILCRINNPKSITNDEDLRFWAINLFSRFPALGIANEFVELVSTKVLINNCYIPNEASKYYEMPYAYEGTISTLTNVKVVFDNSFLVHSIQADCSGNKISIKFRYFNEEDLPTASGEINRETYQDIAYVRFFKENKNLSKMKVDFAGKNIILKMDEIYNEELGFYENKVESGDAKATLMFRLEKYPIPSSKDNPTTSGVSSYLKVFDSVDVIEGDVGDAGLNFMKMASTSYITAYDSAFITKVLNQNINDKGRAVYTNNPLTVSIASSEISIKAVFDEYGATTQYTYTRKYGYRYTVNFTYS